MRKRLSPKTLATATSLAQYRQEHPSSTKMPNDDKKLSLAHCRKVLNKNGNRYTDEEILKIRDFLYTMDQIEYEFFMQKFEEGKLDELKKIFPPRACNQPDPIRIYPKKIRKASRFGK